MTNPPSADAGPATPVKQLRAQNELLKAQLMNTSLINELTKVMHSCTDLDGITKTLLLGIQEILQFDRVILFGIDAANFRLQPRSWVGVDKKDLEELQIPLGFDGGEITDAIFLNRHVIIENPDVQNDPFCQVLATKSYLVIPLLSKATRKCWEYRSCNKTTCPAYGGFNPYCWSIRGSGELQNAASEDDRRRACIACACFKSEGVFWMDRNSGAPVTSDDIMTLATIINQAGIIIENFRIFNALEKAYRDLSQANDQLKLVNRDLQIAQSKINNDLRQARTIQQGLLPQNLQYEGEFVVGARYIPAHAVGGDYYDVFAIAPGVYGIIVADVSGHGIASALIMSMAKVLLKTFAANEPSPQTTLQRINQTFLTEIKTDNFVTIFYAVLDTANRTIRYTSAGHCPVLFLDRDSGECTRVNADGLFLGVFADMMLNEASLSYGSQRKRLVLYTDGLTEMHNVHEEMFDINRLEEIAVGTLGSPPQEAVEKILANQKEFCGPDRQPEDDITLLVIDL